MRLRRGRPKARSLVRRPYQRTRRRRRRRLKSGSSSLYTCPPMQGVKPSGGRRDRPRCTTKNGRDASRSAAAAISLYKAISRRTKCKRKSIDGRKTCTYLVFIPAAGALLEAYCMIDDAGRLQLLLVLGYMYIYM